MTVTHYADRTLDSDSSFVELLVLVGLLVFCMELLSLKSIIFKLEHVH